MSTLRLTRTSSVELLAQFKAKDRKQSAVREAFGTEDSAARDPTLVFYNSVKAAAAGFPKNRANAQKATTSDDESNQWDISNNAETVT